MASLKPALDVDSPSSVEATDNSPDDKKTDNESDQDDPEDDTAHKVDESLKPEPDSDSNNRHIKSKHREPWSSTSRAVKTMAQHSQPGWWPARYAPKNPNDPNCISGMKKAIKMCIRLGRDPEELWREGDPSGIMIEAIRQHTKQGVVTQRVFPHAIKMILDLSPRKTLDPPKERTRRDNETNKALESFAVSHRDTGLVQGSFYESDSETSCAIPPSGIVVKTSTDELSMVEVDSNAIFDLPYTDSLGDSVSRLRSNEMLKSIDIQRCEKFFPRESGWHVFEPGFPFSDSVMSSNKVWPRNLVFFCHASKHWSLYHLDTAGGVLHHYNSLKGTEMPVEHVKAWIERNLKLEQGVNIRIVEEVTKLSARSFDLATDAM